ncbi:MAG: hypothetical protein CO093_04495 [Alphaproteobacteria bacterium CG_4_9_14_3_um_filter_47_13]|nr:MAG: hypothetical protein CO093_04495 [Alphaproteobacteria bacterium CG_4_9_14_3_um_filter_47_13]
MARAILALNTLYPLGLEALEKEFELIKLSRESDPENAIQQHRNDIVAIIAGPGNHVSRKLIEALPALEMIGIFAVGTDNVDLEAARERSILVTNTPDILTADTADIALALLLAVTRRVVEGDAYIRIGKWLNGPMPLGVSLAGKTVGIVGLGRIGQAIAKRLTAFDMRVVYHGRSKKDVPYKFYPQLLEMAQDIDFLVLSCAGGTETKGLVGEAVLKLLGVNGFLINVARGSVVDEEALLVALRNKDIAGAGLDVFANEPFVPEALYSMDNVVLLPHTGSATTETRSKMAALVIENIRAHFEGKPLKTLVAV